MTTKNTDKKKSYVVVCDINGFNFYLSLMGGYSRNNYVYMWEPGVHNARSFDTKKDAKKHAELALKSLNNINNYEIWTKFTHRNGHVEIGAIKQYKYKS